MRGRGRPRDSFKPVGENGEEVGGVGPVWRGAGEAGGKGAVETKRNSFQLPFHKQSTEEDEDVHDMYAMMRNLMTREGAGGKGGKAEGGKAEGGTKTSERTRFQPRQSLSPPVPAVRRRLWGKSEDIQIQAGSGTQEKDSREETSLRTTQSAPDGSLVGTRLSHDEIPIGGSGGAAAGSSGGVNTNENSVKTKGGLKFEIGEAVEFGSKEAVNSANFLPKICVLFN